MRKYGQTESTGRKHKKINKMNAVELAEFKEILEIGNQVNSKVYADVLKRMN